MRIRGPASAVKGPEVRGQGPGIRGQVTGDRGQGTGNRGVRRGKGKGGKGEDGREGAKSSPVSPWKGVRVFDRMNRMFRIRTRASESRSSNPDEIVPHCAGTHGQNRPHGSLFLPPDPWPLIPDP